MTGDSFQEEKAFSINVPSTELVKEVDFCGIYSGKNKDKSGMFEVFYGDLETAPLIRECPINLEGKMTPPVMVWSGK